MSNIIKIQIKSTFGKVLFECEKEHNTIKKTLEEAVKVGVDLYNADLGDAFLYNANLYYADLRGANLCGANLCDVDLGDANLCGADLHDANLYGANLCNADLCNANLCGADLYGANLCGADLRGANLDGVNLCSANLHNAILRGANLYNADLRSADLCDAILRNASFGKWGKINSCADILFVGSIGSRNDTTMICNTDKGIFVKCGCFNGMLDEFINKVKETHKGNIHERNYLALVEFAKIKFSDEKKINF